MMDSEQKPKLDVVLFISDYGAGGVERMLVNTARALSERGLRVALVLARNKGAYLDELPATAERLVLDGDLVAGLAKTLRERRPCVAISGKLDDDSILADARDEAASECRIFFRVGNPLGYRLVARRLNPIGRWLKLLRLRRLYARADGCIAVSRGIKGDLQRWLHIPEHKIHVLPNPVITPEFHEHASIDPGHSWLRTGEPPVILGVGGLREQKDFSTLLRAFAITRSQCPCRLIILGEGRQRRRLEALARRLGITQDFDLPGWRAESHAFMARAAVFALSSRWEGSPNVLVEAAEFGTPIVATDCPYGPREILQDGRYGELVEPGDLEALAAALHRILIRPHSDNRVSEAATPFRMEESGRRYALALGLASEPDAGG